MEKSINIQHYNLIKLKKIRHLIISLKSLEIYIFMFAKTLFGKLDKYRLAFYLGAAFYLGKYGNLSYIGPEMFFPLKGFRYY